ncbi:hypothetical protein R1sor_013029 [Riccia sorocarpa]|uniref:Uncharacterized protein n=1 Tax=Riccia sorocarpa TaxID=122646 RepID=A0ABD3H8X5_9MARC
MEEYICGILAPSELTPLAVAEQRMRSLKTWDRILDLDDDIEGTGERGILAPRDGFLNKRYALEDLGGHHRP